MSNNGNVSQEFEFKAEMKQLLHLIIHSLYTHPEVFLRELVSNASDALNKIRFLRLTENELSEPELPLNIQINVDKEAGTFSIEDTGIGMDKEDLVSKLGTIASSGTLKFLEQIKESGKALDGNLIGQFGVGFYSAFMVTDEITVETRSATPGSQAYKWVSQGENSFSVEECEREHRGTKISFKLKEEHKNFAEETTIKQVLKKYSNFVDFPIMVGNEEINNVSALWQRKKDDISEEEYNEFYNFIANDYQASLGYVHLNIEGNVNFKAVLFIPSTAPMMLFQESGQKNIHLYSSRIFIQDDADELLPEYLRFVKGVVDTEDLPLNVSREVTQSSPVMTKIRNILTGKILSMLEEWTQSDQEKYNKFFKNFGPLFKTGVNSDFTNRQRIIELLRFESSHTEEGELTSFNGYVSRMKADQKEIYYAAANYRDQIVRNPNFEYFKKNEIEVFFLTDPVDIFTIPYIDEYDGKRIVSIDKAEIDTSSLNENKEKLNEDNTKTLIELFKSTLGEKVEDVQVSNRLVDSPVTLVAGKNALDPQLERMMHVLDKNYATSKRILEINTSHTLIKNLSKLNLLPENEMKIRQAITQLYEGALLLEGQLGSPAEFVSRMFEFMTEATN